MVRPVLKNWGTVDGRRRGGAASIAKFKKLAAQGQKVGFRLLKPIGQPGCSASLAEFIGIVLGDGSISHYQVRISSNALTDRAYVNFIRRLIKKLFGLPAVVALHSKNTLDLTVSSRGLVAFLGRHGLRPGDKIRQGASVPPWIYKDTEYAKACLRGLIDTDGGIYFHCHTTKGIRYRNIGLCFTSLSPALLKSSERLFKIIGVRAHCDRKRHISIYNREELNKFMEIVGSHNPKHLSRYRSYKGTKVFN